MFYYYGSDDKPKLPGYGPLKIIKIDNNSIEAQAGNDDNGKEIYSKIRTGTRKYPAFIGNEDSGVYKTIMTGGNSNWAIEFSFGEGHPPDGKNYLRFTSPEYLKNPG